MQTVGELEVIDFLEKAVAGGTVLLIDSRVPEWFAKGTVPGAVNVPFSTLEPTNPYRDQILEAFGAVMTGAGWDFFNACVGATGRGPLACGPLAGRATAMPTGKPENRFSGFAGTDWKTWGELCPQPGNQPGVHQNTI